MSEPVGEPSQEPQSPQGEFAFIRLPSGEVVGLLEMMHRERLMGEVQMNVALLKPGDLIAMQYPKDGNRKGVFIYEVEETEWGNLGIAGSHAPHPTVRGELRGSGLPEDVQGKKAYFEGSGFGGSMRQSGVLVTGRSPYFHLEEGEFRAPAVTNFKVFRRDANGELRVANQEQIDTDARRESEKHQQRLAMIEELMRRFGFDKYDFRDGRKSSHSYSQVPLDEPYPEDDGSTLFYEDDRYEAQFEAGMAMGNQLAVLDKKTNEWTEFKYYNYNGEDILQVGFANLSGQNLRDLFITGRLVEESSIHCSRAAITTFTTSARAGIGAVNYKVSEQDAARILGIPSYGNGTPCPDIQLSPEGKIKVPLKYPFNILGEKHSGLNERIQSTIGFNPTEDGSITLSLNGHERKLKNPDAEIAILLQHMSQPRGEQGNQEDLQKTTFAGRVRKAAGRFIRRGE